LVGQAPGQGGGRGVERVLVQVAAHRRLVVRSYHPVLVAAVAGVVFMKQFRPEFTGKTLKG
jgi:hypothetical protein